MLSSCCCCFRGRECVCVCVCVCVEGGRGSEGGWREREGEGVREGGVYLRVQYAILFQR